MIRLLPARQEKRDIKVIADLDALISQPIGFRFGGREFVIEPVSTEKFMQIADSLGKMQKVVTDRASNKDITEDDVYQAYYDFVKSLCSKISMKDLKAMTLSQINALIALMVRHISGATDEHQVSTDEKKKILA